MLDAACAWKLGSLAFKLLAGASKALDHEAVATFLEIGATSVEAGEAVHDRQRDIVRTAAGRLQAHIERNSDEWLRAEFGSDPSGRGGCGSGDSGPRRHSSKVPPRWAQRRASQSRHRADRRPGRGEGRRRRRDVPQGHIRRAAAALPGATRIRGSQARPRLCHRDWDTGTAGVAGADRRASGRSGGTPGCDRLQAARCARPPCGDGELAASRETIIEIARRLGPDEMLDFDQAVVELERAVDMPWMSSPGASAAPISTRLSISFWRYRREDQVRRFRRRSAGGRRGLIDLGRREAEQRDVSGDRGLRSSKLAWTSTFSVAMPQP